MDSSLHENKSSVTRAGPGLSKPLISGGSLASHGAEEYLIPSERDLLRSIIRGTVASMTAQKLSARYEIGLEHDRLYDGALREFCALIVSPGVRLNRLLQFLRTDLPPGQPDFIKIIFLETVARLLGQKWVDDDCDFIDVTIGTARLQEIIRALSFEFRSPQGSSRLPLAVLVAPVGEQHTLMLHLLGLLFDSMGWSSRILEGEDGRGSRLKSAVEQADIVCIGWSNLRLKDEFTSLVKTIRLQRPTARPPIIAGGIAALDSVDFLVSLGIDCLCDSVYSATRICESFYELESEGRQANASRRKAAVRAGRTDWLGS